MSTSAQSLYSRTLRRIFAALEEASDPMLSSASARLARLFDLVGLRATAGRQPTIDRHSSGFPILADIVSLANDRRDVEPPPRSSDAVRLGLLDAMLIHRRELSALMIDEMADTVYAEALLDAGDLFAPEPGALNPHHYGGRLRVSWDMWDGAKSMPVFCRCWFEGGENQPLPEEDIRSIGRRFSGSGFTPLSMAVEIDDALEHLRLKRLRKLTVGPFRSPIFGTEENALVNFLAESDDDEANWALFWRVDEVISSGTEWHRPWFLAAKRPRERFVTDTRDPELVERGASSTRLHMLMPPQIYRCVADLAHDHEIADFVRPVRMHVLSADNVLTEDL